MKEEELKDGEYHIMKLFIICTLHKILFVWSKQGSWDRWERWEIHTHFSQIIWREEITWEKQAEMKG
jgi:hypothetical protein